MIRLVPKEEALEQSFLSCSLKPLRSGLYISTRDRVENNRVQAERREL